jgi:DNA-binding transcriptional ArsR family regulator
LVELARGFSRLSDPTRVGILETLAAGPRNYTALCRAVGQKPQTVTYHLRLLKMDSLVNSTRKGKSVIYVCNAAAMRALSAGIAKLMPRR